MAQKTQQSIPHRGKILDIITQNETVLYACQHKTDNLGIYAISGTEFVNKNPMQLYQLPTQHPIVEFCKIGAENKRYAERDVHHKTDIIFAIDQTRSLYRVPDLSVLETEISKTQTDIVVLQNTLQKMQLRGNVKFATMYSFQELLLLLEVETSDENPVGQIVVIFDIEKQTEVFSLVPPQSISIETPKTEQENTEQENTEQENTEQENTEQENTEQENTEQENTPRFVTAIASHPSTGRFALGFSDGLFEHYKPTEVKYDFSRQLLLTNDRQSIRTVLHHDAEVNALLFVEYQEYVQKDEPPNQFLSIISCGLDTQIFEVNVTENIPRSKVSSNKGHKKNVEKIIQGFGNFFYTTSRDDLLMIYSKRKGQAGNKSITMSYGPSSLGRFYVTNNRGQKHDTPFLIQSQDASLSMFVITDPMIIEAQSIKQEEQLKDEDGTIQKSRSITTNGLQEWLQKAYQSDKAERRKEIIELAGTWKDNVAVYFLRDAIFSETNPDLVERAIVLLYETKHPKMPLILEHLLASDQHTTCWEVIKYLREIYGERDLYPLDLAFSNRHIKVRERALVQYADLARKPAEDNMHQYAFEKVYAALHDVEEIQEIAFELLCSGENPLYPGVKGIMYALTSSDESIQLRALDLLYHNNLIEDPASKDDAGDLLRQIRESNNSKLRYQAYLLSLTIEHRVLDLLRNLDKDVHTKITDLENIAREEALEIFQKTSLLLDQNVMDLFEHSYSNKNTKKISKTKQQDLCDLFSKYVRKPDIRSLLIACSQYPDIVDFLTNKTSLQSLVVQRTVEYCIETFPFEDGIQNVFSNLIYLHIKAPPPAPRLEDLTEDDLSLLQEMASSFHPEISSLGTLAQAKLGMISSLPTLLLLCNESNALYRSRAVDGLLEFLEQPIVRQKLHDLLLTAPNIETINPSADKAYRILQIVEQASFTINRNIVQQMISYIFEDGIYSSSERRVVRTIFESHQYTWTAGAQVLFLDELKRRVGIDSDINIRAKIFRSLWTWYNNKGEHLLFLAKTQNSDFDDVRSTSVSRLQECIGEKMENITDTKSTLSEKDWDNIKSEYQQKIDAMEDLPFFDTTVSLIGVPREVQNEVMLLNKTLHWRGNTLVAEALKTYLNKKIIYLDEAQTRSRLLGLSIYDVFSFLCERIYTNIQASVTKGVEEPWFWEHVEEILNLHNENWALEFYNGANSFLSKPRNEEEHALHKKGYALPVEIRFEKIALCSRHEIVREASLNRILSQFNQAWVVPVLLEFFMDEVPRLRRLPLGFAGQEILRRQQKLKEAVLALFQHEESSMIQEGLLITKSNVNIIDREIIEAILEIIFEAKKPKGRIGEQFVADHILHPEFVKNIPLPQTFSADLEQKFFEALRETFPYETIEDIQHELELYEKERASIKKEILLLDETKNQLLQLKTKEGNTEQISNINKKRKELDLELARLKKPMPKQDVRFLLVVDLLSGVKGSWVVAWFDDFMSRSDEQLSNRAFDASFKYHASQNEGERLYIASLLQDNHARLDDVVQKIFSLTDGWRREMITKMLRLNRIDLVFSAFDELCKDPKEITTEEWKSMLHSPYEYIRMQAYDRLLSRGELETPIKHLQKLIRQGRPKLRYKGLRTSDIKKMIQTDNSIDPSTRVQLFLSSVGSNGPKISEILRFEYKISPSRIRRIFSLKDSIVISKVKLEDALELQERLENYGATVYICEEHQNYYNKTLTLWRGIMDKLLIHVRDNVFEDDRKLYEDLRFFEESTRKEQWNEGNLRKRSIQALGSVTPVEGHEYLHELLSDPAVDIQQITAISLIRCRQETGLQYLFSQQGINQALRSSLVSGILCCGEVAESYVRKLILRFSSDEFIEDMFWLWLLQRSQIGGSLHLLTSILNSHHKQSPLIAAKLFGFVHDQKSFASAVYRLLGLSKVHMNTPLDAYSFTNSAQWLSMMAHIRDAYGDYKKISYNSDNKKKVAQTLTKVQWMELASLLASTNGRIRYRVSDFVQQVLDGRYTVKEVLSFITKYKALSTSQNFESFLMNDREFSKQEAVQFSFGSLAGLIRSNENDLVIRRKAFRYLIYLSRKNALRSISGILSVMFQSSQRVLREDALTLGLLYHEEMGLTREEIIRLALNGVAWRNQNMSPNTNIQSYDSMNYMIISEFHTNGEHERILRLISEEPHGIAEIALELLLQFQEKGNGPFSYRIPSLKGGLVSKNLNIRRVIIRDIDSCLFQAKEEEHRNQQHPQSPTNIFGTSEAYIQLLISGLQHGLKEIREQSAAILIRERRHEVLNYIYQNWLKSKDASDQKRACDVLTSFRPVGASSKILDRFLNDPTETAHTETLKQALIQLSTYNEEDEKLFFTLLKGWNDGQRGAAESFDLLAHFSGYTQDADPELEYRNWIVVGLLKEMLNQSRYQEVLHIIYAIKEHPISEYLEIDQVLEKIATIKYNELTAKIRYHAVKECARRYQHVTPGFDQPEDATSTYEGWKHLRNALFQNYNFHPVRAKLGKEISDYAFESAIAVVSRRGYPSFPFTLLKKVLEDSSGLYSYEWKERALHVLGTTRSNKILRTLLDLIGLENTNASWSGSLFHTALYLIRYYVTSIPDMYIFINHMWNLGDRTEIRSQVLDTLQFFTDIEIQDFDFPTKCTEKLLHWKNMPSMGWLNMLMALYKKIQTQQLKKLVNEEIQKTAFVLNVNKVYEFYCKNIESGDLSVRDITFDLQIYKHNLALFLTELNFDILHQRIKDHGIQQDYLSLLRFSIGRARLNTPLYVDQLSKKGIKNKIANLPLSFQSSYTDLLGLTTSLYQYRTQSSDLDALYEEIAKRFTNSSQKYELEAREIASLSHWSWADEVNLWESEIHVDINGLDLYVKLLLEELYGTFEIYDSVLDMIAKYKEDKIAAGSDLEDEEKQRLEDIVGGLRKQWEEYQRNLRRGESVSPSDITKIENAWIQSFQMFSILKIGQQEIEHALGKVSTNLNSTASAEVFVVPKKVVYTALTIYLNPSVVQDIDQNLLLSLYKRFPEKQDQLLPYFSLDQLALIVLQEWNVVHVHERAVHTWIRRMDHKYKNRFKESLFWMGFLSQHHNLLQLPEFASFQTLLQTLPSQNDKKIRAAWNDCDKNLIYVPFFLKIIASFEPLYGKLLVKCNDGWPLFHALKIMHAHKLSPYIKKADPANPQNTIYVLSENIKSIEHVLSLSLDSKLQDVLETEKSRHQGNYEFMTQVKNLASFRSSNFIKRGSS